MATVTRIPAPSPRGIREWLTRRFCADSEGEFSRLDFEAARTRILRGLVVLRSAGWNPTGFVRTGVAR